MSKKTTHGGRTLYINPEKSVIEAELDALLRISDRPQPLMRSLILAGFALSKEGISWDPIKNRLTHGKETVSWPYGNDVVSPSNGASPSHTNQSSGAARDALRGRNEQSLNEGGASDDEIVIPQPSPIKNKFSAFLKGV